MKIFLLTLLAATETITVLLCGGCAGYEDRSGPPAPAPSTLSTIRTPTTVPASPATDGSPFTRSGNGN